MSPLLDNLKQIVGGDISRLINDSKITLALINVKTEQKIINNGPVIQLNVAKLTDKERTQLLPGILREAVQTKDALLITEGSNEKIDFIDQFEHNPGFDPQLITFVQEIIPSKDKTIWKGALLLRRAHLDGNQDRSRVIRQDLIDRYGDRARNITNLCTAGYLEQYIRPLWGKLSEQGETGSEKFQEIYESIVTEQPFAVFVSSMSTEEQVIEEVHAKKDSVIKYGWRQLAIHGMGEQNIRKVQAVADKIKAETGVIPSVSVQRKFSHIKVLFRFE